MEKKFNPVLIKDGKLRVSFALFKNDNRQGDRDPQAKFWDKDNQIGAAAWTKESTKGDRYQSCSLDLPVDLILSLLQENGYMGKPQTSKQSNDFDEDLPF